MNELIYRGVAHAGLTVARVPAPATMVYRGAAYDRTAAVRLRTLTRAVRQYRGVTYNKGGLQIASRPAPALSRAAEFVLH